MVRLVPMDDLKLIEEFENSWSYLRDMTDAFIKCVPETKWTYTHHDKFAPLVKQFKHIVKVYGCYIDAFKTRKLDMSKKGSMFEGAETRENILQALKAYDQQLKLALENLKSSGLEGYKVDVFGMSMGFSEYTHVLIQHEAGHYGLWANYAAFGGFETPPTWRSDWKL
jgi:uncharacterized damage-inducible protein DinB